MPRSRTSSRVIATRAAIVPVVLAVAAAGAAAAESPGAPPRPAERVLEAAGDGAVRGLLEEILERNPQVASDRHAARAAEHRAPQARALPEPTASVTAFLATPETRVGPQRLAAMVAQRLPWRGTRGARERAALWEASGLAAGVEARRLEVLTRGRRLLVELTTLDREERITRGFRRHLLQHEEIARVRYSTGVGLGQAVIQLQAEVTRVDGELLGFDARRKALEARLNALRDRPADDPLPRVGPELPAEPTLDVAALVRRAQAARPEPAAAEARRRRAEAEAEVARKAYRPDVTVGLTYTLVEPREDAPGRAMPPPGNGDDVLGLQAGLTLPVRRDKLAAALAEAEEAAFAAAEARRASEAAIAAEVAEIAARLPVAWRQLRLLEDVLVIQAEESLDSAQAGYVAGTLNALDLLGAEHVLFNARLAAERARADVLIALAELEGAVGEPLAEVEGGLR